MKFFIAAVLLCSETLATFSPDFLPSTPGFHISKNKLKSSSGYRLPGTARPLRYDLTLNVDLNGMTQFMTAQLKITLDIDNPGNGTKKLQLNSGRSDDAVGYSFTIDGINCPLSMIGGDYVEITCDDFINGTNRVLQVSYTPQFRYDMSGAYVVEYMENGAAKYMVTTQFEQDKARYLMPCFDEPEYKAPIKLTLVSNAESPTFSNWVANMPVESSTTDGNTKSVTTVFKDTPSMSTYLLAFVISDSFITTPSPANANFSIFSRASSAGYVNTAIEYGPKLMDEMGNYTGIKYGDLGDDKMTLAAIPEFAAGAMENWGLITFREQIIIDEADRTTNRDKQYNIEVIAHELSHQWFGDYVTMDWWSDTFLNEGFANYFEYFLTDKVAEDFHMMHQMIVKSHQRALKADALSTSFPLANNASDVTSDDDLSNEFGDISYLKGASVINMMRYTLGDDRFQFALQTYLKYNSYSNGTPQSLLKTIEDATGSANFTNYMQNWIFKAGYPVLDVFVDDDNKVIITASKFSTSLNKTGESKESIWWLPITYTTSDKANFDTFSYNWIDSAQVKDFSLTLPEGNDSWIVFNLQSTAFYRVNYDTTLLTNIINVLNNTDTFNKIHVLNRAQLLDDVFNIAKYYDHEEKIKESYLKAFALAEYLKFETEYYPWYTFFVEMQELMDKIHDADTLQALEAKILDLISAQLKLPSSEEKLEHTQVLLKNLLLSWACRLGHEECVEWAKDQFTSYKNNTSSIDNNYRDVILCTGLANSEAIANDFKFVSEALEKSTLPYEGKDLAKSLGCIKHGLYINQTLFLTINAPQQRFNRMFYSDILSSIVSFGGEKAIMAAKFFLDYQAQVKQYWSGVTTLQTIMGQIGAKITSQEQVDVIQSFITSNKDEPTYEEVLSAANHSIEVSKSNFNWLNKYSEILTSVIMYDGEDIPPTTTPKSNKASGQQFNMVLIGVVALVVKLFM